MVQRDPKHQASLQALIKFDSSEICRRIDLDDYRHPSYVASEVLASMVRARFGINSGVLDRAGAVLYKRLMTLIDWYFRKNSKWKPVVDASSETLKDATGESWLTLLTDKNQVSFAEVRFLPWVEGRTEDFLRQQLAKKNQMQSLETMSTKDEDGNETRYENTLQGDEEDAPDAVFEREQLKARLMAMWMDFELLPRKAVYFRLVCEYEWSEIAKLLNCSRPTARKYYNIGTERLKGAIE
jgi:hypothetical protein